MGSTDKEVLLEILRSCFEIAKGPTNQALFDTFLKCLTAENIASPSDFYGWVSASPEDQTGRDLMALQNREPSLRENRLVWAKIKDVYRRVKGIVHNPGSQDSPAALEEPLEKTSRTNIEQAWGDRYFIKINDSLHPSDAMLARMYREFRKGTPNLIKVKHAISLFMAYKPDDGNPSETPIGNGMAITQQKPKKERMIQHHWDYYEGLRIIGYCCAKVGNFMVDSKLKSGKVLYAPLDTNLDYADECLRRTYLMPLSPAASLAWLEATDLATRGAMVSLMRHGWPQGEALEQAIKEHAVEWKLGQSQYAGIPQQLVSDTVNPWTARSHVPTWAEMAAWMPGKGKGKGKGLKKKSAFPKASTWLPQPPKTAWKETKQKKNKGDGKGKHALHWQGKEICKRFNAGNCAKTEAECPGARAHVCDVLMPGGKPCGGPHPRSQHK